MHAIQSIFVNPNSYVSSLSNSTSDEKQRSPPTRRLRVFQEITSTNQQPAQQKNGRDSQQILNWNWVR